MLELFSFVETPVDDGADSNSSGGDSVSGGAPSAGSESGRIDDDSEPDPVVDTDETFTFDG